MSPAPPLGISTSTYLSRCMSSLADSLPVSSTRLMQSSGSPALTRASLMSLTAHILDLMASLPPLSMHTFPDLRQRAAASTVTLGLASYMMPMTPRGTLFFPMISPLGLVSMESTWPMGSGNDLSCLTPSTMPSMRFLSRLRRSSMELRMPEASAALRSSSLAESHSSALSISMEAIASRASFFLSVPAEARLKAACFASFPCLSRSVISSAAPLRACLLSDHPKMDPAQLISP